MADPNEIFKQFLGLGTPEEAEEVDPIEQAEAGLDDFFEIIDRMQTDLLNYGFTEEQANAIITHTLTSGA